MWAQREDNGEPELPPEWKDGIPTKVFIEESNRIVDLTEENGIPFRLIGGLAFRLHSKTSHDIYQKLGRLGGDEKQEFTDIDGVIPAKMRKQMDLVMTSDEGGYVRRRTTLSSSSTRRAIYLHPKRWWFVDCFWGQLRFNHSIHFEEDRLILDRPTIPVTELLLEKLQIVEISHKDVVDCMVLLDEHSLSEIDDLEAINMKYIADRYLSKDWGFYYTVTQNLRGLKELILKTELLESSRQSRLVEKVDNLLSFFDSTKKSRKWKLRAKVGTKRIWYRPVETGETVSGFGIFRLGDIWEKKET